MDKNKKLNQKEEQVEKNDVKEDAKLDRLQQEVEEYKAKYLRSLADYQNLEKRVREEKSEWIKLAGKNILLKMLPVLDTLMMASKHSKDQNLLISIAQFMDALKAEEVTRIETTGKDFDPSKMEAVQTVEGDDGKVIDEVRPGFMLHDKLLRAAEVTVGKKK